MPNIIRADTDQLRAVARQMRATADQITNGTNGMHQSMDALDATWSGQARDRGMARWAEMTPKYPPAVKRLEHFANELEALAQRLDDAAAVFGDGNATSPGVTVPGTNGTQTEPEAPSKSDGAPKNMFEMFKKIRGAPEIKVIQVGENEFAVTIDGTQADGVWGGNGWINAVGSNFGFNTSYADHVRQALASLPPGAQVHMFGYSQGGIIAQNLAREDSLFSQHNLKLCSVTTFGTPRPFSGYEQGVKYKEFDAPGDVVSSLGPIISVTPESNLILQSPESKTVELLFNSAHTVMNDTHGSYEKENSAIAGEMKGSDLPFAKTPPDQWEPYKKDGLVVTYDMSNETVTLGEIGDGLKENVSNTLTSAGEVLVDGYNHTTGAIQSGVEGTVAVIEDVGEKIEDSLNQGAQSVNNFIQNPPWPFG